MRKRICIISVVIIFLLFLIGCSGENERVVRPPIRESDKVEMSASLDRHYTLKEAFEEADLVVYVKIGNWLGEGQYSSYYETKIVENYKGNEMDIIVLLQDGTSNGTYKGYPLFTYGNEMLVFLKQASDTEFNNAYWIMGAWTTLLDVIDDGNGNMYYVDRSGMLSESINASLNVANDTSLREGLYENTLKRDAIVADIYSKSKYVYEKSDIDDLLMEFADK